MKCPKCGFENLEEANFCIKCGHRIDGKIPCPKCQEYIPNDAEHCPHCGKVIPHRKANAEVLEKQDKSRKDEIARVFNFVSCFVTLFLFVIAIVSALFRPLLDFFGPAYSSFPTSFSSLSGVEKTRLIIYLSLIGIDSVVCLVFSIIGIVKTSKAFKNYSQVFEAYKYLAIVLVSSIVSSTLLRLNYSYYTDSNIFYVSSNSTFITLCVIHLLMCIGFDCFLNFKKNAVSIFIARIILGVGIFIPLILLNSLGDTYVYYHQGDNYFEYGLIQHFVDLTAKLIVNGTSAQLVSTYVVCSISMLFMIIIVSLTYSFFVYYVVSYFRGMNKFRKFRIAFYMADITLSIFATGFFISSIVDYYLYISFIGKPEHSGYAGGPVSVFVLSILLVGVAVATFNIYNRANRRAKLEEKTTKVE